MKSKKSSNPDLPQFSAALREGTKNVNVNKDINLLCDKLISDAIEDEVIPLETNEEKIKFRKEFLKWSEIDSHLSGIAEENISEIIILPSY